MPIKSKAQRRKFAELLVKGEISPETFEEWNRAAGNAELPERLHPKSSAKRKRKKARVKQKRKVKSKRAPKSKTTRVKKRSRPARKRR
jgi:macrodomain Ter protein organizer (MatP/YcbG family)